MQTPQRFQQVTHLLLLLALTVLLLLLVIKLRHLLLHTHGQALVLGQSTQTLQHYQRERAGV